MCYEITDEQLSDLLAFESRVRRAEIIDAVKSSAPRVVKKKVEPKKKKSKTIKSKSNRK